MHVLWLPMAVFRGGRCLGICMPEVVSLPVLKLFRWKGLGGVILCCCTLAEANGLGVERVLNPERVGVLDLSPTYVVSSSAFNSRLIAAADSAALMMGKCAKGSCGGSGAGSSRSSEPIPLSDCKPCLSAASLLPALSGDAPAGMGSTTTVAALSWMEGRLPLARALCSECVGSSDSPRACDRERTVIMP